MEPTSEQIEDQLSEALSQPDAFPALSYADGVVATLEWITGKTNTPPMSE